VIREDFVIEAYEIMEVQVQLLLARMGVIEDEELATFFLVFNFFSSAEWSFFFLSFPRT
jgi:hypothetical protein